MAQATPSKPRSLKRRFKTFRRALVAELAKAAAHIFSLLPFGLTRRAFPLLVRTFARPILGPKIDRHLQKAFGAALSPQDRRRIRRRVLHNLGLFLAEVLANFRCKLPPDYVDPEQARPLFESLLQEKKGVIFLSAHIVNWELAGDQLARAFPGRQVAVFARRMRQNPRLHAFIEQSRLSKGMEIIYQDESPRRALRVLKGGGILGILPDQDIKEGNGVFVPFFGHEAWTTTGPASLALLSGCPIVCAHFERRPEGGLRISPPEILYPKADSGLSRKEAATRLTQAWMAIVETWIRQNPSTWVWFHDRWRTTPERLEARRKRHRR
jgi:KDO2-lipid IV(A) lauroyltransferase